MNKRIWNTTLALVCCACTIQAQQKNQLRVHVGDVTHTYTTSEVDSLDMACVKISLPDSVQAIDLGLSVKWASCNLGASQPYRYGAYFAWGETAEKSEYSWTSYMDGRMDSEADCGTTLDPLSATKDISGTSYDAATDLWGEGWRTPTIDEIKELLKRCQWNWTMLCGVWGYCITGPNGASIFLPMPGFRESFVRTGAGACGIYLSSHRTGQYNDLVYGLYIDANNVDWTLSGRLYGHSIRPVIDK